MPRKPGAVWRFAIVFSCVFSFFYLLNLSFIGLTARGGWYCSWLDAHVNYIRWWRNMLLASATAALHLFNYPAQYSVNRLVVPGEGGIILSFSCLGYGVLCFLAGFTSAWPGKSRISRLRTFAIGFILMQSLNVVRIAVVACFWHKLQTHSPVGHHMLFNTIIYSAVLAVLWIWINAGRTSLFFFQLIQVLFK